MWRNWQLDPWQRFLVLGSEGGTYTISEQALTHDNAKNALLDYRKKTGIPARLVVGMTSKGFTIADPDDAGKLNVVGFSTNTPSAIADFVADRLGVGEGVLE